MLQRYASAEAVLADEALGDAADVVRQPVGAPVAEVATVLGGAVWLLAEEEEEAKSWRLGECLGCFGGERG